METPDFRAIIDLWPTRTALKRDIAEEVGSTRGLQPYQWHSANLIPEKWFDALVKVAGRRGFDQVTYPILSRLYRERART